MAFTQVSGTVLDPSGFPYAGARWSARLVSTATPRVGANLIDAYANGVLDANGAFNAQLVDNATVTPVASTWTFAVDTDNSSVPPPLGTGPQSFSVAGITITGASQDVSAALQAAAPELTRTISSGGGGGIAGGIIGPSAGHPSVAVSAFPVNAVLEILANGIGVSPLILGNTDPLAGQASIGFVCDGQSTPGITYIFGSSDNVSFTFIEFSTLGGFPALQFDVGGTGSIGFFNKAPVVRQVPAGGIGGSPALASLLAALGVTTGSGLITETTVIAGQTIAVDGAINPIAGNVAITKVGILTGALAAPTTPAQDFTILRIVSTTANAHVINGPVGGFNAAGAGGDVATFTTAAIGDSLTLMAFNGVWYIVGKTGTITLS